MKAILFNLIFSCLTQVSFSQDSEIQWAIKPKLTWEDFKGSVNSTSEMSAETFSGINYEASILSNSKRILVELEVYSYFDKNKSWKKEEKQTPELLLHEQGHFDITELYARMLRKTFAEYSYSNGVDQKLLDKLFWHNKRQLDSVQMAYDTDTDHSRFEEGQKLWEQFIADSIIRFDNYSDPQIQVVIELRD